MITEYVLCHESSLTKDFINHADRNMKLYYTNIIILFDYLINLKTN